MTPPLAPPPHGTTADQALDRFLAYVEGLGLSLYPAQEEALLELFAGKNVILNTPTGSGKSLVATGLHYKALTDGGRSYYVAPIKALANEKFLALCNDFGPENVGIVTGDARVNPNAPILCCTAEILANRALREGRDLDVDAVILDEFHYYGDRDRGWAWQVPLLTLPQARFLLMSATLGPMDKFVEELEKRTGVETKIVRGMHRPVPLEYTYRETPLHESVGELVREGKAPVYLVNFTQRACAEVAQDLMSQDFASKEEKKAIAAALEGFRFDSPYGKEIQRFLRHGVGVHHAGLLPKYRLLVERLAQRGMLKVISGTDTLGVGVNVPIRTVLFTRLCKYDGEKTTILSVRDFQQIAGRAGRKGFDDRGYVHAQAPEHVIENLRIDEKVAADPSKKKKLVRKKPPEFGYVEFNRQTFERLTQSLPEPLVSRFQVTHAIILNVLQRPRGGGCKAIVRLVRDSHDTPAQKKQHRTYGLQLWTSLLEAGIVEPATDEEGHRTIRLHIELQDEFSLNQSLALWLVDTVERLDRESDTYALDVLTLAESIVEDPDVVLRAQLDKMKGDLVAKLKAEGVEYDDRMKQLDELEYPKPCRELVYDSYNEFAKKHPWVIENIKPKSIARDVYETLQTFSGYVKTYGLSRSEGVLLRYLSEVYKVMVQTVPAPAKTEAVEDITAFLGAIVRGTDASLLEEWERLRDPSRPARTVEEIDEGSASDVTRDDRGFTVMIRNAMFKLLSALAARDVRGALSLVAEQDEQAVDWTEERLRGELDAFFADHTAIRLDSAARAPSNTRIDKQPGAYRVVQVILDPEEDADWFVEALVDLPRSREAGEPVLVLSRIAR